MRGQFRQLGVQFIEDILLLVNFGNPLIQAGGGLLNAFDRLQPAPEVATPLAQLRIQLRSEERRVGKECRL